MGDAGVCLIGGCGSSGTTLLAHLLDGIHDIRCSPEAYIFHHRRLFGSDHFQRELYRALAQLSPKWHYDVAGWSFPLVPPLFISGRAFFGLKTIYDEYDLFAASPTFAGLVAWLKRKMVEVHGFPEGFLWVDQTPKNVYGALGFLESFPDGKFVHLIRDGRDVIASLARRYALEFPGKSRRTYLSAGALRWCVDVSHGLKARGKPGYLEVRYEDLVGDPLKWVNVILDHVGRPEIDDTEFRNKQSYAAENFPKLFLGGDKPSWGANPSEGVNTSSVGRWRRDLDQEEMDAILSWSFEWRQGSEQAGTESLLRDLGYLGAEA